MPKLLELMKSKEFKWNHGSFCDAIATTEPASNLIPSLLNVMRTPEFEAHGRLGDLIAKLVAQNPNDAEIHHTALAALLTDNDEGVRLDAAYALAKFPGEKDLSVMPELLSALHLSILNRRGFENTQSCLRGSRGAE